MYSDKFELHIVELPKVVEGEYPDTPLLKWARVIRAEKKEDLEMIAKTDPYIEKAYEELLHISADEEKRLEYEARQKAILDHNYLMRINWEDGYARGEAKGEEKKLVDLIVKKINKVCSVPQIADMLAEDEPLVQEIYGAALEFAPDYNTDKIMERIKRNLSLETDDVVPWCKMKILEKSTNIERKEKNWYAAAEDCVITINAHSYTIITAHKGKS